MGKPAARVNDFHMCPKSVPFPHVGGPILSGAANVLIGSMPAAVLGDACLCALGIDCITTGSKTVLIGGRSAARMGDATEHGGQIQMGCPSVLIGD